MVICNPLEQSLFPIELEAKIRRELYAPDSEMFAYAVGNGAVFIIQFYYGCVEVR